MASPIPIRPILIDGDTAYVTLTRGYVATIDAADVALVEGRNWCALVTKRRNAVYACRGEEIGGVKRMIIMHRVIAGTPDDMDTDHADGDGLNNRRSNLRICSRSENTRNVGRRSDNTSGFKGVSRDHGKWRAEIHVDGQYLCIGRFDTPEKAHQAYAEAATKLHGEFARVA